MNDLRLLANYMCVRALLVWNMDAGRPVSALFSNRLVMNDMRSGCARVWKLGTYSRDRAVLARKISSGSACSVFQRRSL